MAKKYECKICGNVVYETVKELEAHIEDKHCHKVMKYGQ